ncbi:unnamed protein product [Didymodactylos carnosus]|uniref:FAD dependent oxidoreductase domain-containing protein n=1 Tax=Didymodactylos carnosus TaxID=1234261 RepID=A0A814GVP9_9BILA|nr:unnamed protein product [Didymodactylos carnosus]CAF1001868.1 unnamed protein product [Didymodactylos carnosus]CAF3523069.1 unnamed protein product [Didymodactylos carnosus]CAF3773258.1 unnamed protein product [Didymodactylos carnosus]
MRTFSTTTKRSNLRGIYNSYQYDTSRQVESLWEMEYRRPTDKHLPLSPGEQVDCKVAIIGAGYTGLSCALHLVRDYQIKGNDLRVFDAGRELGWGASGRNGGFCCMGATHLSSKQMIQQYGLKETQKWMKLQVDAVKLVRSLIEKYQIDAELTGDSIVCVAHSSKSYKSFEQEAQELQQLFSIPCTLYPQYNHGMYGALKVHVGFGLNPLKYLNGLAEVCQKQYGVKIHQRSQIIKWDKRNKHHHRLYTDTGACIQAEKVVIAANGYMPESLHSSLVGRIMPVLSNIIVTRALTSDELMKYGKDLINPHYTSRHLLNYYRLLPDSNRFLFGGRGDTYGDVEHGEIMKKQLLKQFHDLFPLWANQVKITHYWSGLVCFTRNFGPSFGYLNGNDKSVWYSFGYHANGVNTATYAGKQLAKYLTLATQSDVKSYLFNDLPHLLVKNGLPPKIPFSQFRLWYLRVILVFYRLLDYFR